MSALNEETLKELELIYEELGICHDTEELMKISQRIAVLSISIATSILNERTKK